MKKVLIGVGALVALFMILYTSGVLARGSLFIPTQLYMAICLTVALGFTFIIHRSHKTKNKQIPWYDWLLIGLSLASVGYVAVFYPEISNEFVAGNASLHVTILAIIATLLILEATRRLVGIIFPIIVTCFLLITIFSNHLPWLFHGKGYPLDWMAYGLFVAPEGIFGVPLGVACTIIIAFLLFGNLLVVSGAGKLFVDLPMVLFGRVRGGPAKVTIGASALFGTMTGSAVANVATTGTFTIPLMRKTGYSAEFSGAVEAVSSTGSQFTPPVMGGVIFIMAQWLGLQYFYICLAAAIPAFLYYFNEFMVIDLEAARHGMKGLPKESLPSLKKTLKEGWQFLLPLVILVILLAVIQTNAGVAALYSSISIIIVSWFRKDTRIGIQKLINSFSDTFKQFIMIGMTCAAAGLLIGALNLSGIGIKMGGAFLALAGGNILILLILSAIAAFVMGMGMHALAIYVILSVLLAPALIQSGVPPICAHFFIIINALLSLITPPVALAVFAASAISGGDIMKTGWQAVRIGALGFILPFWIVYRPALMLQGSPSDVVSSFILAVIATCALAAALMGYGLRKMNVVERIWAGVAALLMIIPGTLTDILGLSLTVLLMIEQIILSRRHKGEVSEKANIVNKLETGSALKKWILVVSGDKHVIEVDHGAFIENSEETKDVVFQRDGKLTLDGQEIRSWQEEVPQEIQFEIGGKHAVLQRKGMFNKQLELFFEGQQIKPV